MSTSSAQGLSCRRGGPAYGVILYLLVYGFSPGRFALFVGFVVLGGLLVASARFAAETLTFFLGNAPAISKLLTEFMLSFSVYPRRSSATACGG